MKRKTINSRIGTATLLATACAMGMATHAYAQPAGEPPAEQAPPPADRATLLREARAAAVEIVLNASRSDDPRERAAALEAAQGVPDRAMPLAQLALSDDNPGVRFAALVTIGRLQLESLGPAAVDLADDENPSVRGAALFAAHRCGVDVDRRMSYLAQMLGSQDPVLRGNAAMLLGMLGDEGAIPMLHEMAFTPLPRVEPAERIWLQLQFAEAILRIEPDNEEMLEVLRSSVYSPIDDLRVLALRVVGEVGDRWMLRWMDAIVDGEDPIQVRVAAARSLAQMGGDHGRSLLMQAAQYDSADVERDARAFVRANRGGGGRTLDLMRQLLDDPDAQADIAADVRAQAAFGLGELSGAEPARRLSAMLEDAHPAVRLAAAAAVLDALAQD